MRIQNLKKEHLILFILWAIATLLNVNKAFHIDDVFHLEFAQYLNQHPLTPMSGMINWENNSAFNYNSNQPPLYFYLLALSAKILGYSEIPLHLFQSVFTLLAMVFFYKIAVLFTKHSLFLTALFVLNPAFLLNQNLMIDVPLLSLTLIFFYLLLRPCPKHIYLNYSLAAFVLGLGLLMKYSNLPLLVVLFFTLLLQKQHRLLYVLCIPIAMLALWNIWIYCQNGVFHLSSRETSEMFLSVIFKRIKSFVICIGAICPFSMIFIGAWLHEFKRLRVLFLVLFFTPLLFLPVLVYNDWISEYWSGITLRVVFFSNGVLLLLATMIDKNRIKKIEPTFSNLPIHIKKNGAFVNFDLSINLTYLKKFKFIKMDTNTRVVVLWILFMGGFFLFLAPFMATRHLLLILPAILFLCTKYLDRISIKAKAIALGITAFLGLTLGVSDWNYANLYREKAIEIKQMLPNNVTTWTAGHWGWQWYSKKAGMKQYESDYTDMKLGDYLVYPSNVSHQHNSDSIYSVEVKRIIIRPKLSTFFSTAKDASFYSCDYPKLPWFFAKQAIDTIKIYKVVERLHIFEDKFNFQKRDTITLDGILHSLE